MREVISVHLGQAGVQLGATCWELYCREHGLDPEGRPPQELGDTGVHLAEGFSSFFQEMSSGNYAPLALFADLEPTVVGFRVSAPSSGSTRSTRRNTSPSSIQTSTLDEEVLVWILEGDLFLRVLRVDPDDGENNRPKPVRNGAFRKLHSPANLVTGTEDAANNYARGAYSVGKNALPEALEPLRKMAETCERLQGFMLSHSFGGGTGSGFNAIVNEALSDEYPKRSKLEISIFPSPTMSTAVVEPYNAVLNTNATLEHTDCVFLSDNEAMYKICQLCLDIDSPSYSNLNHLLALTVSSITASLRFKGSLNADFTDFQTNLVPYPKIHFPIMSYAPIVSSRKATHETMSISDLTSQSFSTQNRLLRCENESGHYMSCCLLYRGDVVPREINDALQQMKDKKTVKFVNWAPTGFKVGINDKSPVTLRGGEFAPVSKSVCMLCNTTAIKETWSNLNLKYSVMLDKKAFLHWYVAEGLDPKEFIAALDNILTLEQDYAFMSRND